MSNLVVAVVVVQLVAPEGPPTTMRAAIRQMKMAVLMDGQRKKRRRKGMRERGRRRRTLIWTATSLLKHGNGRPHRHVQLHRSNAPSASMTSRRRAGQIAFWRGAYTVYSSEFWQGGPSRHELDFNSSVRHSTGLSTFQCGPPARIRPQWSQMLWSVWSIRAAAASTSSQVGLSNRIFDFRLFDLIFRIEFLNIRKFWNIRKPYPGVMSSQGQIRKSQVEQSLIPIMIGLD